MIQQIRQSHAWVYSQKNGKLGCRYVYTYVHSSITHNCHKTEVTRVSGG